MDLAEKKKKLREELKLLEKEKSEKDKEIKEREEYKELANKLKLLKKELPKLQEREDEIEEEIRYKYLIDGGEYPSYSKSSYYGNDRNIKQEVINSIKRSLGIKSISLLKASDIEKITKRLIDEDMNKSEELKEAKGKRWGNEQKQDNIEEKQVKLLNETKDLSNKISEINDKFWKVRKEEEKLEKLKDEKEVARQKRWKKKEEAEKKLKNNFNQIVQDVRIGVTKEEILNQLSEDEEN